MKGKYQLSFWTFPASLALFPCGHDKPVTNIPPASEDLILRLPKNMLQDKDKIYFPLHGATPFDYCAGTHPPFITSRILQIFLLFGIVLLNR